MTAEEIISKLNSGSEAIHAGNVNERGAELYQISLLLPFTEDKELSRFSEFEVWASQEFIEDKLRITHSPNLNDQLQFAKQIFFDYIRESNGDPKEGGAFCYGGHVYYGDPRSFPSAGFRMAEAMVQTNISLTRELHDAITKESKLTGRSMSEVIRQSLKKYLR